MKLGDILASRNAWTQLAQVRLPAVKAYHLFKYMKLITAEQDIIELRRVAILRRISGAPEGVPVTLEPGTADYDTFVLEFAEFLETRSELPDFPNMNMDNFMDIIGDEDGNRLSVSDIALLEPFMHKSEEHV